MSSNDAQAHHQNLLDRYQQIQAKKLNLDLTRGKPATAQLALSDALDGILQGNYACADGSDARNYGGALGIPEAREFAAQYLGARPSQVLVGGNSSLQLMYQIVTNAYYHGVKAGAAPWSEEAGTTGTIKFLCPAPGYDRHFSICETLGIKMIPVTMDQNGPDMDQVESLLRADPLIKGIWCVPKYANPNGVVYSDEVVDRFAQLGKIAGANFRIIWDNAYAEHHLVENPPELANLLALSEKYGTLDNAVVIGSTSKITFAGAGISFMASSEANIAGFVDLLGIATIGPDKVNQLRHMRFLKDMPTLRKLMQGHREILQPKFELVLRHLDEGLSAKTHNGQPLGSWTKPAGGYFVLFDTQPGLADKVVKLCAGAGVKLTPAGSTWPYKKDPANTNIRLAPSFPGLSEIDEAMQVFVLCVELATLEQ
ncbi:aminotransferase class I/II-fold pyridoxal phosphate-dependent enzyme [Pseudohongiella sp.]|uniref:Aminotransferase class I/classII domain-containing protein n=1 Tax=marine sediment metagenome TaxID=412755 RepID=A0A0F9YLI7_9ZZZZ|nr:aminotransferase class I/II-fold pyridoxal phosphate-dependent enzyme [Pseudohongiella sp.]HDZ10305.1 aminotransferase class I/II-fold pyridoxal phosphate-dependent enzyme [Pseudohongiella sp.]HEA62072.1 aminotransferase class I/II-fold pyridoxal phosphate-dependent enzyme [Pseudohongiella sp.]